MDNASITVWRMTIADSFFNSVNNTRQANLDLVWDILPEDALLTKRKRELWPEEIKFVIPNKYFGSPEDWIDELDSDVKQHLQQAFFPESNTTLSAGFEDFADNSTIFTNYWNTDRGNGRKAVLDGLVTGGEYKSIQREFNILTQLLTSSPIEYRFDLKNSNSEFNPREEFPRQGYEDISWEITLYPFKLSNQDTYYYRFTAKAIVERFSVSYFATETPPEPIKFNLDVRFQNGDRKPLGLITDTLLGEVEVETIDPQTKNNLAALSEDDVTALDGAIGSLRKPVSDLLTAGIFRGTKNTSLISGAVADFGTRDIETLIGANWDLFSFGDRFNAGAVVGVEPDGGGDASIFVGPSLKFSGLVLSPGVRFFGQDDKIFSSFSTLISTDLSQLLGGKRSRVDITLPDTQYGGGWVEATDSFIQDISVLDLSFTPPSDDSVEVSLVKFVPKPKSNAGEEETTLQPQANTEISLAKDDDIKLVAKGKYDFQVSDGGVLHLQDGTGGNAFRVAKGYYLTTKIDENSELVIAPQVLFDEKTQSCQESPVLASIVPETPYSRFLSTYKPTKLATNFEITIDRDQKNTYRLHKIPEGQQLSALLESATGGACQLKSSNVH